MQKLKEAKVIARKIKQFKSEGKSCALITIIKKKGSAYRSEGAKFLVAEDKTQVCGISGGCLEKGLIHKALEVIKTGKHTIEHADLKDPATWGMWLGCPGEVDILIEPVKFNNVVNKWIECVENEKKFVLVKDIYTLKTALYTDNEHFGDNIGNTEIIKTKLKNPKENSELIGTIFYDTVLIYPPIVIFGKGEEVLFFKQFGEILGFKILNPDPTENFLIPENSFVVIANHHIKLDRISLKKALNSKASYIGMISSLKRFQKVCDGLSVDERVYVPAGLDIKGESPDEVVLSILSEIVSIFNGGTNENLSKIKKLANKI